MTVRVCFVCLGNICRSPMAEAVARHLADLGGFTVEVDSAGTGAYHVGERPHGNTLAVLDRLGIATDHRGRQFVAADFDRFDLVVAMDASNQADLRRLARRRSASQAVTAEVRLLREWDAEANGALDVPDPWGEPIEAYWHVHAMIERSCRALLADIAG